MRIQKNNTNLKNRINTGFKLFTTIKNRIIVELTSRQANMHADVHPIKAKQPGAKLTYNARRHLIQRDYRLRHD